MRDLPLCCLRSSNAGTPGIDQVVLSAGIHGDEPAGIYGLISFLQKDLENYEADFGFTVFPCLNPTGLIAGTRENFEGVDLNRVFSEESTRDEVRAIVTALSEGPNYYVLSLDYHEDSPTVLSDIAPGGKYPDGFYCYESARHSSLRVSSHLLKHLRSLNVPIATDETVYGDKCTGGAVLYGAESTNSSYAELNAFDNVLLRKYCDLTVVTETLTAWSMEQRVEIHREATCGVLNAARILREQNSLGSGL